MPAAAPLRLSSLTFSPDYDTILAEKIALPLLAFNNESRALFEAAIISPIASPITLHSETGSVGTTSLGKRSRAGVDLPVATSLTTGPVVQCALDSQQMNCLLYDDSFSIGAQMLLNSNLAAFTSFHKARR